MIEARKDAAQRTFFTIQTGGTNMGPYEYLVEKIDGDYAFLRRTDIESDDRMQVARALLPEETDEGTRLRWENLCYTVLEG